MRGILALGVAAVVAAGCGGGGGKSGGGGAVDWTTFSHPKAGFTLQHPTNWGAESGDDSVSIGMVGQSFEVVAERTKAEGTVEDAIEAEHKDIRKINTTRKDKPYDLVNTESITVGSANGKRLTYTFLYPAWASEGKAKAATTYVKKGGTLYSLRTACLETKFEKNWDKYFAAIHKSFQVK